MENSYYMSYDEMRDLFYKICNEVCTKERINVDVYPLTVIDYYRSDIFKKKMKLIKGFDKYKVLTQPFDCLGFFSGNNREIIVFMNDYKKRINTSGDYGLINYVKTIYHELRHSIQYKVVNNKEIDVKSNIAKFRFFIDSCRRNVVKDYNNYHDEYSQEIDADVYALSKTKEYFYKNNKDIYYSNINYFREIEFYNKCRILKYDILLSIDDLNKLLMNKNNLYLLENNSILRFFYNVETGKYRKLSDIINDSKINNFNFMIVSYMLSSKDFLEKVDYSKLSSFELGYILRCIECVYNDYLSRKLEVEFLIKEHCLWIDKEFKNKELVGKDDKYIININERIMKKIIKMRNNDEHYKKLKKILDEYKYHDKIVGGGKIL